VKEGAEFGVAKKKGFPGNHLLLGGLVRKEGDVQWEGKLGWG